MTLNFTRENDTHIALIAPKSELDYYHQDSCHIEIGIDAISAFAKMTDDTPKWLSTSFFIRDKISRVFGVKQINGFSKIRPTTKPDIGDKLDFFDVQYSETDELVLTSVDRHLGVLVSIQTTSKDAKTNKLIITTSVKNKNFFGRVYMIPVRPIHEIIVRKLKAKLQV
ncbi:DUF2867 domain-containing protein [Marinicellulosiphila megalodicopiae]|uniref:DUF2867 domain-containing protein n=1 Tax=Marinicellulosiphila megalodicopiae TaxID=2724896 RepID=UPI003BB065E6